MSCKYEKYDCMTLRAFGFMCQPISLSTLNDSMASRILSCFKRL